MNNLPTTKPTNSQPPAPQSREDAELLAKYRNAIERTPAGLWSISDRRAPAGADREALEARLAVIEQAGGRTQPQTIATRVARLFLRFPSSRLTDASAEATIAAYATDLEPFPVWAIDKAMLEAIQKGGAFAPSSPELRKACERAMLPFIIEAGEIRSVLGADVYHEPGPEEQARGRAMFDALIGELKLREPFAAPKARVPSDITPMEAEAALERMQANMAPLPKLSNDARRVMGLQPIPDETAV